MRKFILAAAALGLLSGTAFAAAQHHATGTIKQVDSKAMTLTLNDGSVYSLPNKFKTSGLKTGEKVAISWNQTGTNKMAQSVMPAK